MMMIIIIALLFIDFLLKVCLLGFFLFKTCFVVFVFGLCAIGAYVDSYIDSFIEANLTN